MNCTTLEGDPPGRPYNFNPPRHHKIKIGNRVHLGVMLSIGKFFEEAGGFVADETDDTERARLFYAMIKFFKELPRISADARFAATEGDPAISAFGSEDSLGMGTQIGMLAHSLSGNSAFKKDMHACRGLGDPPGRPYLVSFRYFRYSEFVERMSVESEVNVCRYVSSVFVNE